MTMNVRQPAEAGRAFEKLFAAGDLEGLMALYEPDALFTNARGATAEVLRRQDDGCWKHVIDDADGPTPIGPP